MKVLDAYQLAARLHTGQTDKAGRPYIEHLTRVMLRVQEAGGDVHQQIAALLHDAIEDGKASADQLQWLGVPVEALESVLLLSRNKDQPYEDYLDAIKADSRALMVKACDLQDNANPARLAALPESVAQRLRDKYSKAAQVLGISTM